MTTFPATQKSWQGELHGGFLWAEDAEDVLTKLVNWIMIEEMTPRG